MEAADKERVEGMLLVGPKELQERGPFWGFRGASERWGLELGSGCISCKQRSSKQQEPVVAQECGSHILLCN